MAGIKVTRQEPVLVVPIKTLTKIYDESIIKLSDIDDQQSIRFNFPVIMAFRGSQYTAGSDAKDPAKVIKEALAKTLVYYYPFAGRIREDEHTKKLLVDCNDEGVLFIEADADVTLKDIETQILPPCPLLEELLYDVPGSNGVIGCPLLLFQVTRLRCGGYILAMRVNHTMCDMLGYMKFLKTMVELSKGAQKPSIMPVWQRELLSARCPPKITFTHDEYEKAGENNDVIANKDDEISNKVVEGFFFDSQKIEVIRTHLPSHLRNSYSTFELISACVWRCRVLALQPNPEETVRYSMTVSVLENNIINLPQGYYGNSFFTPTITTKAKELMREDSLAYVVQLVREARAKVNEEYVRSMIDLMVVERRPKHKEHLSWIASNLTRKGLGFVDFGWGRPSYGGVVRSVSPMVSTFTEVKNDQGKDVISVVLYLSMEAMLRFKLELAKIVGDDSLLTYARSRL